MLCWQWNCLTLWVWELLIRRAKNISCFQTIEHRLTLVLSKHGPPVLSSPMWAEDRWLEYWDLRNGSWISQKPLLDIWAVACRDLAEHETIRKHNKKGLCLLKVHHQRYRREVMNNLSTPRWTMPLQMTRGVPTHSLIITSWIMMWWSNKVVDLWTCNPTLSNVVTGQTLSLTPSIIIMTQSRNKYLQFSTITTSLWIMRVSFELHTLHNLWLTFFKFVNFSWFNIILPYIT